MRKRQSIHRYCKSGLLSLLIASSIVNLASAQIDPEEDLELRVSAYETELFTDETSSVYSCGSALVEMASHTFPFVRFTNTSNVVFDQLMIQIGDPNYHFSDTTPFLSGYAIPGVFNEVPFDVSASALNGSPTNDPLAKEKLTFQFPNGLKPGETAVMQVGLAPDDPSSMLIAPFVDYRQVILGQGADYMVVANQGQSGQMSATFNYLLGSDELPAIGFLRDPGVPSPVQTFDLTTQPGTDIPEPTTMLLLVIGSASFLSTRRRR